MKALFYILAVLLFFLGFIFIVAGASPLLPGRIIVGAVLIAAGAAFILAARTRPTVREVKITNRIELTGDVSLEQLKCRSCSAVLKKENIAARGGAVFVECPYCSAAYQMEEEPKW